MPLARQYAGTVCVGVAGAARGLALWGWHSCHRWPVLCCVCIYTWREQWEPSVLLSPLWPEGEALMSSMHSVPPPETRPPAPTQRLGRWQGGARQSLSASFL